MAVTKNAVLRYRILDECFSNPYRKFFLEDLVAVCSSKLSEYYGHEFSIAKRAIQYDIAFMKVPPVTMLPSKQLEKVKVDIIAIQISPFQSPKKNLIPPNYFQ